MYVLLNMENIVLLCYRTKRFIVAHLILRRFAQLLVSQLSHQFCHNSQHFGLFVVNE